MDTMTDSRTPFDPAQDDELEGLDSPEDLSASEEKGEEQDPVEQGQPEQAEEAPPVEQPQAPAPQQQATQSVPATS